MLQNIRFRLLLHHPRVLPAPSALLSIRNYNSPQNPRGTSRSFRTTTEMDVVLPEPDKLKIVSHRQYNPPESLSPTSVLPSPLDQFRKWFTEVQGKVDEPEAMSLSTATAKGVPSSRFVLLKQADKKGFVFYTNYTSRKSLELEENPYAALAFYWKAVHRQVRVIGRVEKVSREESEEYFTSRPVGSRLGAWASDQSKPVGENEVHDKLEQIKAKFGVTEGTENAQVPLPDHWGGWRVIPDEFEFWSGKPSRLHDRIRYLRVEGSPDDAPEWKIDRLAP